ncbi:MAG: CHAD domain-containing protein [Anaerolineales bacterium]|nr:CHAD domain-containing protein [Anaerolineales bacterium]
MNTPFLSEQDQQVLEKLVNEAHHETHRRRAQILLLYNQNQSTSQIAARVGITARGVRYCREAFARKGMAIFSKPGEALMRGKAAKVTPTRQTRGTGQVKGTPPVRQQALSINELVDRHNPDSQQAEYVCRMALALFDRVAELLPLEAYRLGGDQRRLLEAAAMFHNLKPKAKVAQAAILAQPLDGFSPLEQTLVAAMVRDQQGKIRPRKYLGVKIPAEEQKRLRALIAFLRLALGLGASQNQSTKIEAVELLADSLHIRLSGQHALTDAITAQSFSTLWSEVFQLCVHVSSDLKYQAGEVLQLAGNLQSPGIQPDDPMAEAGRKLMRFYFAAMLSCETGARQGEDIEQLHDMRVATRRLRAAFDIFSDYFLAGVIKPYLKDLRATGRILGQVRDLDVFMARAQGYLQTLAEAEGGGLAPLLKLWEAKHQEARTVMLTHLDGVRYQAFIQQFNAFLNSPGEGVMLIGSADHPLPNTPRAITPLLIYNRLAAVRAFEKSLEKASIVELHALRTEFKRLRYTVEFFREILGGEAEQVIEDLKVIQDHLGELHDADVACNIISNFLNTWEMHQADLPISERPSPQPIAAYLAAKHAERHRLLVTFPEAWERFNRTEFRQKLALAVSAL